jgi:tetratricopeptide (TPR) repeat protein
VDAALKAKDWARAEGLARALTQQEPKAYAHWLRLASALHGVGRYDEALAALKRAGEKGAPPPMVAMRSARAHLRAGRTDAAFTALSRALDTGFGQVAMLEGDAELAPLRADSRFPPALERARRNARPCAYAPESRQFDFWEGEWEVQVSGTKVGDSRVERIANDCVLLENWTAVGGMNGKSFNLYDREQKRWRQTWVDSSGSITDYAGSLVNGQMRFEAKVLLPDGRRARRRMTFSQPAAGQVRQLIEDSTDGGKSWSVGFDGLYLKKPAQSAQ